MLIRYRTNTGASGVAHCHPSPCLHRTVICHHNLCIARVLGWHRHTHAALECLLRPLREVPPRHAPRPRHSPRLPGLLRNDLRLGTIAAHGKGSLRNQNSKSRCCEHGGLGDDAATLTRQADDSKEEIHLEAAFGERRPADDVARLYERCKRLLSWRGVQAGEPTRSGGGGAAGARGRRRRRPALAGLALPRFRFLHGHSLGFRRHHSRIKYSVRSK